MTIRKAGYLQGTVPSPYKLPAEDHRLLRSGLWVPSSALGGLRVRSGIVAGPGNPGLVTVAAGGVNIAPFHAVIDGGVTATQGSYEAVSDAVEFRAITAASATEFRRGYVVARVYDQLNGDASDGPTIEVVYGPPAATAGAAALPPLPGNRVVLRNGEFAVSNTGVITLVAGSGAPYTVARGGVQPVSASDAVPGAYLGQYRDHPVDGLQRWNGTTWSSPAGMLAHGQARQLTAGPGVAGSTWGSIPLQRAEIDSHGGFSATGRYTVQPGQAGVYRVFGKIQLGGVVVCNSRITLNGAPFATSTGDWHNSSYGSSTGVKVLALGVGDYVELQGYCTAASWSTVVYADGTSYLNVQRIT